MTKQTAFISVALIMVASAMLASPAAAEDVTTNSILIGHRAGATAEGLISLINDPANSISIRPEDLSTLRAAGVPETVVTAIQ